MEHGHILYHMSSQHQLRMLRGRKKGKDLNLISFPKTSTFTLWKRNFGSEVCSGSGHPSHARIWIIPIDSAKSVDYFRTTESVEGHHFPNFETLDAKIANALKKILAANDFCKKAFVGEQKAQNENRFLR